MYIIKESIIEHIQDYLDERYTIMKASNDEANTIAYEFVLKTIENFGFDWRKDKTNGHHLVFSGYNDHIDDDELKYMDGNSIKELVMDSINSDKE